MSKLQHFETNKTGRDFVVGDLHGCLHELAKLLEYVGFNKDDRLFSVGDLVDRGPESLGCAYLMNHSWFHLVKGNHEDLMAQTLIDNDPSAAQTWAYNGGDWFLKLGRKQRDEAIELAQRMAELPLVITVGDTFEERFNIVHAEMFHDVLFVPPENGIPDNMEVLSRLYAPEQFGQKRVPLTNEMIDAWVFSETEEVSLIWGRELCAANVATKSSHDPVLMSLTFCGHTPMHEVLQFGQQMYLDCGAVYHHLGNKYSDRALILAEPAKKQYHRYGMLSGLLTTFEFDTVLKWAQ